jgi:hypothetical protein
MSENIQVTLGRIVQTLGLTVKCGDTHLSRTVLGGYVSDLLSDVMAHARTGSIWVTLQGHPNIIAVAKLKELSGIIIVNKRMPEAVTIEKARTENIPIITTDMPAFEVVGKLYEMGIC